MSLMDASHRAESPPGAADLDALLLPVRRALVARYGTDVGAEAAAEVAVWAVEHDERLAPMTNPGGYLFRVGQTAAGRLLKWGKREVQFPTEPRWDDAPDLDGDVFDALRELREEHRTAVLLVHGYDFTYSEVADLLGVSESAVTNFVHRGMTKLRSILGEEPS
ncbi:MAG: RNA polymerase sigma factor [Actinomycetota bacterium]|nr:RNA polymerase sigma factor [Actinomycetota bacterium]